MTTTCRRTKLAVPEEGARQRLTKRKIHEASEIEPKTPESASWGVRDGACDRAAANMMAAGGGWGAATTTTATEQRAKG